MMNCPHCYQQVPDSSAFCQHCGARLAAPDTLTSLEIADDPAYGALAQANLLRLRGKWDAAREKTVSVLREFPNSATAHSLMGDVYADQGLHEGAAQWYRMALDLEPSNAADERKLAMAEARNQAAAAESPADVAETPPPISPFRVAAIASVVFLVAMIGMGFWFNHVYQPPPQGPLLPARPPVTGGPGSGTAPRQPTSAGPSPSGPPAATLRENPPPASTAAPAAAPTLLTRSVREDELMAALAETARSTAAIGLRLSNVQIDPHDETAIITLDGSGVNGAALDWTLKVVRGAEAFAQRSLKSDTALSAVTVRLVMPLSGPKGVAPDVAFIGRIPRDASGFTERWWQPGLTVSPAVGDTTP